MHAVYFLFGNKNYEEIFVVSASTPQPEEEPLLGRMRRILNRATEVSKRGEIPRGLAQITANQFHYQLAKIYGKESKELQHFPLIKGDLSDSGTF